MQSNNQDYKLELKTTPFWTLFALSINRDPLVDRSNHGIIPLEHSTNAQAKLNRLRSLWINQTTMTKSNQKPLLNSIK